MPLVVCSCLQCATPSPSTTHATRGAGSRAPADVGFNTLQAVTPLCLPPSLLPGFRAVRLLDQEGDPPAVQPGAAAADRPQVQLRGAVEGSSPPGRRAAATSSVLRPWPSPTLSRLFLRRWAGEAEPLRFSPERWMHGAAQKAGAWIPFGGGPRWEPALLRSSLGRRAVRSPPQPITCRPLHTAIGAPQPPGLHPVPHPACCGVQAVPGLALSHNSLPPRASRRTRPPGHQPLPPACAGCAWAGCWRWRR